MRDVGFDHQAGVPVVVLATREDARLLPIWIGPAEAQAIAIELKNVVPPRPMTHDLLKRILDMTGVVLRRVRITDLQEQTFYATLVLDQGGRELEVDSRPSDAIALALRFACPIAVRRDLMERAARPGAAGEGGREARARGRARVNASRAATPPIAGEPPDRVGRAHDPALAAGAPGRVGCARTAACGRRHRGVEHTARCGPPTAG